MGSYYVLEGPLEELMFVDASLLLIVSCHDVGTILCCRVLWFYWEIEAGGAAGCVNQVLEHFPVSVAKELQTSSTEYCKTTHMTCIQGGAPAVKVAQAKKCHSSCCRKLLLKQLCSSVHSIHHPEDKNINASQQSK